ncbi:MAG: hypothetical protein Kow0040_14820 [Thermogutta sp.]
MMQLRNAWLPAAAVFLLAAAARCQEPAIAGPDEVQPGDLVILRLNAPESAKVDWQAFGPSETLTNWAALEDGRVVVFASRNPGVYNFVCAVWDGERIKLLLHRLTNGDGEPEPDPPQPGPGPNPTDWAGWTKSTAESLVTSRLRAEEAKRLSQAMRSVVSSCRAGVYSDSREARAALRAANRAALGSVAAIEAWRPFSDAVDARLDRQAGKGELSLEEYAAIWERIAAGLEEVR